MPETFNIIVTSKDTKHDRWWNTRVGRKFKAKEKNADVFEIVGKDAKDTDTGFLISKTHCRVLAPSSNQVEAA